MTLRRDVEVQLEFLAAEQGGRTKPVRSGYRPQLFYDGHDWDAHHEYPDVEVVNPGDCVRAYLTCLTPESHVGKLVLGRAILIREGQRVVAYGTVTKVIELRAAACHAEVEAALERYYLAIGEASRNVEDEQLRRQCRAAFEETASVRAAVRESGDLSRLHVFLDHQRALRQRIPCLTDSLDEARVALERVAATKP